MLRCPCGRIAATGRAVFGDTIPSDRVDVLATTQIDSEVSASYAANLWWSEIHHSTIKRLHGSNLLTRYELPILGVVRWRRHDLCGAAEFFDWRQT